MAPVGASLQAAQALTEGRRGPAFNHYKAAADALQSLSWVVYTGPNCGMRCSASADSTLLRKLHTLEMRPPAMQSHLTVSSWKHICSIITQLPRV